MPELLEQRPLVFISWSGERSRLAAEALRTFIPRVIEADGWLSSVDIRKGSSWRQEINEALSAARAAIVCLAHETQDSAWVNYEAGAIGRADVESPRRPVCTFLLGVEHKDVAGPLAEYQATRASMEETKQMVLRINSVLPSRTPEGAVGDRFRYAWPELEAALAEASKAGTQPRQQSRRVEDICEEILERVRALSTPRAFLADAPGVMTIGLEEVILERNRVKQIITETAELSGMSGVNVLLRPAGPGSRFVPVEIRTQGKKVLARVPFPKHGLEAALAVIASSIAELRKEVSEITPNTEG